MIDDDPLLGVVLDGRYRVESLIARGGICAVYRAQDQDLGTAVALKVVLPGENAPGRGPNSRRANASLPVLSARPRPPSQEMR